MHLYFVHARHACIYMLHVTVVFAWTLVAIGSIAIGSSFRVISGLRVISGQRSTIESLLVC